MRYLPSISVFLFVIIFALSSLAQEKTAPTPTPTPESDEIIRISSKLVLIDALVLDKKGNQVKDLTPDDFEVYQDGQLQKITNFSYMDGKNPNSVINKKKRNKKAIPPPPFTPQSTSGRLVTFVVDNGCSTSIGLANARDSIKKFIKNDMLPSDRVAIYGTRSRGNLFQMYTSNKEVLRRIANKLRWFPLYRTPLDPARDTSTIKVTGEGARTFENEQTKEFLEEVTDFDNYNRTINASSVLTLAIERLKSIPQRKIIFFISDCNTLPFPKSSFYSAQLAVHKRIADAALRSSVVLYTMNSRGLTAPGFISAEDDVLPGNTSALRNARASYSTRVNQGLALLAKETGGEFFNNKNFLDPVFRDVLEKETGYYLIGYQPDSEIFKGKNFHNIEVKLKRDDLEISSRRGFYSQENKKNPPKFKNSSSPLYQAIVAPFNEGGIDINLTTITENNSQMGNYIRAIFHIKGEDLTFVDDVKGMKKVVLDVIAVAMDEKSRVAGEFNRTYPIRIPKRGVEIVKQNGLDYSTDIPIKKSGFYSFRIAVRDENSKRIGSAGNFVRIRKSKKRNFYISSLLTTGITKQGKPFVTQNRKINSAFAPIFVKSVPSIRQYTAGEPFAYTYNIYNAKINSSTQKPNLTTQFRVYKDGKLLVESKETSVKIEPQNNDMSRIKDYGFIRLSENAEIGDYVLQLIIRDKITKKSSTDWIDFEIVK